MLWAKNRYIIIIKQGPEKCSVRKILASQTPGPEFWSSEPMSTAGHGDMHLKSQHLWGRATRIPGACWCARLDKSMSTGYSETLAQTWVWLQDVEISISNRRHHSCSFLCQQLLCRLLGNQMHQYTHCWMMCAVIPTCQAKCAHCCNTDNTITELTKCFLINIEPPLHRREFLSGMGNLIQTMNMKVTDTSGEPAIVILLNVCDRKLPSKCLRLYT